VGATGATSSQEFDPWGAVRSGSVPQTSLNYTGQRKDGTGLLYYHARYYDPALARWTSPDSIVPGRAMGAGGALGTLGQDQQTELRPLTVDFHEPGLAVGLGGENRFTQAQGFRFQLSARDRQQAKDPSGPGNPQALNRYSYVLDNPLRYADPTGHALCGSPDECGGGGGGDLGPGGEGGPEGGPIGEGAGLGEGSTAEPSGVYLGESGLSAFMPESETGLYEWTSEDSFVDHYREHAIDNREFEYQISEGEYAQRAEAFVESVSANPNVRFFVDRTGSVTVYNESTNELAVVSNSGRIVSYFRPSSKVNYYDTKLRDALALGQVRLFGGPR
jgi:RHS repeat-associated protein